MMARTRKRDDDSQCNSDATSLAALDASSLSATGSRSSLTFCSSTKAPKSRRKRPAKRRKKSLTEGFQAISLDKDKGVPQHILSASRGLGGFPFSNNNTKSFAFSSMKGSFSGTTSPLMFGSLSGFSSNFSNLNSKQQANRQSDKSGAGGDGDIYYDDDNSQLTSSSDEDENIGGASGMEDNFDDDDEEDEEDSLRKRLALMTDFEKAQRQVMLKLVFGKDHKDSLKPKTNGLCDKISSFSSPREVSSCVKFPPGLTVDPVTKSSAPLPPFATISTATKTIKIKATTTSTTTPSAVASTVPIPMIPTPLIPPPDDEKDKEDFKNPVDRKIEELLRRSLKNLREGSHPLCLSNSNSNEDNDSLHTPWKTQDDMVIDPQIYSRRVQQQQLRTPNKPMALDSSTESNSMLMTNTGESNPRPKTHSFRIKRSNSFSGGFDIPENTNVVMDMDE